MQRTGKVGVDISGHAPQQLIIIFPSLQRRRESTVHGITGITSSNYIFHVGTVFCHVAIKGIRQDTVLILHAIGQLTQRGDLALLRLCQLQRIRQRVFVDFDHRSFEQPVEIGETYLQLAGNLHHAQISTLQRRKLFVGFLEEREVPHQDCGKADQTNQRQNDQAGLDRHMTHTVSHRPPA